MKIDLTSALLIYTLAAITSIISVWVGARINGKR